MINFEEKYIKYKLKYFNLKKIIKGGGPKKSTIQNNCRNNYSLNEEEKKFFDNRQINCLYADKEKSITINEQNDPNDINEIFEERNKPWISGIIDINKSYDRFINKKMQENPSGDLLEYLNNQINEKKVTVKKMYDDTTTLNNQNLNKELLDYYNNASIINNESLIKGINNFNNNTSTLNNKSSLNNISLNFNNDRNTLNNVSPLNNNSSKFNNNKPALDNEILKKRSVDDEEKEANTGKNLGGLLTLRIKQAEDNNKIKMKDINLSQHQFRFLKRNNTIEAFNI